MNVLRLLAPFAALLLLVACADGSGVLGLGGGERAEQVSRDVGAILQGMRQAHALD